MTSRNIFITFLLLIAGGLSTWSILLTSKPSFVVLENKNNQPDAIMENIVTTVMNKTGTPALKVETPMMMHYAENDSTELLTPHVTVYRQSPEPWHIKAKHARTQKGVSEILFWGNVVIHHLADTTNPMTTMRTPTLTVFPDQQIAKTEEAVVLTQPDTIIRAVGMLANWEAGTVRLLSQAREEYVPKS